MFIYASLLGIAFATSSTPLRLFDQDDLLPPPPLNGQITNVQDVQSLPRQSHLKDKDPVFIKDPWAPKTNNQGAETEEQPSSSQTAPPPPPPPPTISKARPQRMPDLREAPQSCVATYTFNPQEAGFDKTYLTFNKMDLIYVLPPPSADFGWSYGKVLRTNEEGWYNPHHVYDLPPGHILFDGSRGGYVSQNYDPVTEKESYLTLHVGDKVEPLYMPPNADEWAYGKITYGELEGQFGWYFPQYVSRILPPSPPLHKPAPPHPPVSAKSAPPLPSLPSSSSSQVVPPRPPTQQSVQSTKLLVRINKRCPDLIDEEYVRRVVDMGINYKIERIDRPECLRGFQLEFQSLQQANNALQRLQRNARFYKPDFDRTKDRSKQHTRVVQSNKLLARISHQYEGVISIEDVRSVVRLNCEIQKIDYPRCIRGFRITFPDTESANLALHRLQADPRFYKPGPDRLEDPESQRNQPRND